MKKKTKKFFWLIIIALLIVFLIILVWWYYPITRIDSDQLILKDPSISIDCLTDSNHKLRDTGIRLVSNKAGQQLSGLKKKIVLYGVSKAFPEKIRITLTHNPETKVDTRVIVVDFGRGIKLMHLAQQAFTRQLLSSSQVQKKDTGQYSIYYRAQSGKQSNLSTQPQACAWIESGLIMSNDLNLLTELVSQYRSGLAKDKPADQPDIIFYLSNKNHELTERIREQEKKLKYAISPTIDLIDHAEGTLTMQDADKGSGKMNFYLTNALPQEQQAVLESNIEFLKEELRKQIRAQGKELTATVSLQDKTIVMDYQIAGLSR
jgi:hypothetical protein